MEQNTCRIIISFHRIFFNVLVCMFKHGYHFDNLFDVYHSTYFGFIMWTDKILKHSTVHIKKCLPLLL